MQLRQSEEGQGVSETRWKLGKLWTKRRGRLFVVLVHQVLLEEALCLPLHDGQDESRMRAEFTFGMTWGTVL